MACADLMKIEDNGLENEFCHFRESDNAFPANRG